MTARIIYTKAGADPDPITWPQDGPDHQQWSFNDGVVAVIRELIGYPDGTITFPDGRVFPGTTSEGSTFKHQLGV
jgi:hypothetical protein